MLLFRDCTKGIRLEKEHGRIYFVPVGQLVLLAAKRSLTDRSGPADTEDVVLGLPDR